MDALSHALTAWILFSTPGLTPIIPFAVLGSVILDADIFFPQVSDGDPSLYLFTHGGIAHSIAGAFIMSLLAYGTVVLLSASGFIPAGSITAAGGYGFAAILAGALLHVAIDVSAIPGIPLLAPFSDRKFTLGILPGPSLLLAVAAFGVVLVTILSVLSFSSAIVLYGVIVLLYLAVRTGMFLAVGVRLPGRKIPSINPFRWLVIREDESSYVVRYYTLFHGYSGETVFEKYRNTDACELATALHFPEVRRLFFFSYIVTAEHIGSDFILTDPLREKGFLYYPMKYRRVEVKLDGGLPDKKMVIVPGH